MILQQWLNLLCKLIPKVESAVVVDFGVTDTQDSLEPSAAWPNADIDVSKFESTIPLLKSRPSPLISSGVSEDAQPTMLVAYPLVLRNSRPGAVILESKLDKAHQTALIQMLDWGSQWLQLLFDMPSRNHSCAANDLVMKDDLEKSNPEAALFSLQLVQKLITTENEDAFLVILANELARYWSLQQVYVGVGRLSQLEIGAVSYSASFDTKSQCLRDVQQFMRVVAGQDQPIAISNASVAEKEHVGQDTELEKRLLAHHPHSVISAISFKASAPNFAVVVCIENESGKPQRSLALEPMAVMVGPLLGLLQLSRRTLRQHLRAYVSRLLSFEAFSAPTTPVKVAFTLAVFAVAVCLLTGTHRVRVDATLEGRIQRAVVAPFDGYIENAFFRAGDVVDGGDVIVEMDSRPLQLEKQRWLNQQDEFSKEYRRALSELNHSQARIAKAKLAQADAQLSLVENRIKRAALVSPLAGMIVSGDLSRSLGAPVERGQVLFEVAPLDEYRLGLKIEEQDIAYIKVGQQGELVLSAYPNHVIRFRVEHLASIYSQDEQHNWYRAEASIETPDYNLRPGMEGVGKIEIGERSLAWIWCHNALEKLALWLWAWIP